jgi:amidohydrolase
MKHKIQELAKQWSEELISIRRHLHAHPELSYQEVETSAFIRKKLTEWGISYEYPIGGEGILAKVEGHDPTSRSIALRGDMDALPIIEGCDVPYKSKRDGVMHACGHDVHTTCLLGAAKILNSLKNEIEGTYYFVFQPGEEKLPGGASLMLKDGIFSKEKPSAIFGQHVYPELLAGQLGFGSGPYMASTDEIYVTVKGKGGHGAKPDKTIDPVLISAHLIVALQQVVSRWTDPILPAVLSFGKVMANGATNVIPQEVKLEGTFRTFDETWRKEAHDRMRQLAKGLVEGMGGTVNFDIVVGYPVVYNDPLVTDKARALATEYVGEKNVVDLKPRATAEDFAYFSQVMPGCFYRLGTASADGTNAYSVHHPLFNVDESSVAIGAGFMAFVALNA